MSLSKSDLFAALARPTVEVDVPEIGGSIHVREMSVRERLAFNKKCFGEDGKATLSAHQYALSMVASTLADADGNRLFNEEETEALWDLSEPKIGAIARACERVNGFGKNAVEEEEKNSEATAKSTSSSSLPKPST